jgi:hypothetical protein
MIGNGNLTKTRVSSGDIHDRLFNPVVVINLILRYVFVPVYKILYVRTEDLVESL